MKRKVIDLAILGAMIIGLAGCFGQHNNAPNPGKNLDDKRIYGNIGGEPMQLPNKYDDDDGTNADRANAIRNKFFPK